MARYGQVLRQWRLWRLLASSQQARSARALAERLPDGVTPRTIRRDLEVLRTLGVPIREVGEGAGLRYVVLDDGPGLRLDGSTLLALRLALGLLRPLRGTSLEEGFEQLVRALEARVPIEVADHFAPLGEVCVKASSPPDYGPHRRTLEVVQAALAESRSLLLHYESVEGAETQREVQPQGLVYGPRGFYLLALDTTRQGAVRTFRLERVLQATLGDVIPSPQALDPGDYLAGSLGIHSPEHPLETVRLRLFSRRATRLLQENPWHQSQRVEAEGDTWILTLELTSTRELVSRVLALGPDAEVLAPSELREEIGVLISRSKARYASRTSPDRATSYGNDP